MKGKTAHCRTPLTGGIPLVCSPVLLFAAALVVDHSHDTIRWDSTDLYTREKPKGARVQVVKLEVENSIMN